MLVRVILTSFFCGKHNKYKNETEGIRNFILKCPKDGRIVLEPTGGYERALVKELSDHGLSVSIVNPGFVRNFARSRQDLAKTDRIDAQVLSEYGEKMDPKIYMLKEEKQRLEKRSGKIIEKDLLDHIKYLEESIKKIASQIEKILEEKAIDQDEVLQSEKGIGSQTSAVLIGCLPELGRIDNRQIAKLAGLAPMSHDSGKMSKHRHIRGGRSRVRIALFMASVSAIRSNPKVKDFYKRLRGQGKPSKVALIAVARKILIILNSKMRLFYEGKNFF